MSESRQPDPSEVARQQLQLFLRTAQQTGMDADRMCQSLRLSRDDWQRWLGILHDAPLPSHPELPLLLRHLGYLTNRLDRSVRAAFS